MTDSLLTPFIPQLLTDSQKLDKILLEHIIIKQELDTMAEPLSNLDSGLAALNTSITNEDQSINALATSSAQLVTDVNALVAKIQAGQDFTNEVNAVQAAQALVNQSLTNLQTAASNVSAADSAAAAG